MLGLATPCVLLRVLHGITVYYYNVHINLEQTVSVIMSFFVQELVGQMARLVSCQRFRMLVCCISWLYDIILKAKSA